MVKSSLFTPPTLETMITMLIKVLYINSLLLIAVPRPSLKTKGDGAFEFVAPPVEELASIGPEICGH